MLERLLVILVILATLSSVGCGGMFGGEEEEEFEILEFDDAEPTPMPAVDAVIASVGIDPYVLLSLRFLYGLQVRLETLKRITRDMKGLAQYESDGEVNLQWVIDVHQVTDEVEGLAKRVKSSGIPESEREQYEYLFVGLLESIDLVEYGSLRLLAAATVLGPSGRSLETMGTGEREEFVTFVREAEFFLEDGDSRTTVEIKKVGSAIGRVGVR